MTRISTIAQIHQRLYRDQDNARIRFGTFVTELCADLQGGAPQCSLEVNAQDVFVPTDKAMSLALIVSELVSNAFEYAYPSGRGAVSVALEEIDPGDIRITVADRGCGLPEGFSVENAKTLGMVLIAGMVKQLKGRIEVRRADPGAIFVMTASIREPG
jgi:two-component sensor histidine kinase